MKGLYRWRWHSYLNDWTNGLRQKISRQISMDFDCCRNRFLKLWGKLLIAEGLELDPLSNEIWMPMETQYVEIFKCDWVLAMRAETEFIMLSKALKAPAKNKVLLRNYIATRPPLSFFKMCQKYKVDLSAVIEG